MLEFVSDLLDLVGDFEFLFSLNLSFSFFIVEEELDFVNDIVGCGDLFLVEHDLFSQDTVLDH